MTDALDLDRPDALGIVGYSRPESMAALRWARRNGRPTILMSESQEGDHPRVWWKEAIKRRRVRRFSAGPGREALAISDYLARLGMPADRIALGYNAVDNEDYARRADAFRARSRRAPRPCPKSRYFLAVNRFVPEKNLARLVRGLLPVIGLRILKGSPGTSSCAGAGRARRRSTRLSSGDGAVRFDPPAGIPPGRGACRGGSRSPRRASTRA